MSKALFIEYRPHDWQYFVGHEHLRKAIALYHKRGSLGGRAFLLTGPSGVGKSTAGYLIASDVCDPENILELDAGRVTPKDIEDLERQQGQMLIGEKPGRAFVINEIHGLRTDTVKQLLVTLERIHKRTVWIFTTTLTGRDQLFKDIDAHPLMSRCVKFELKVEDYADKMILRAKEIAEIEGLGGATKAEFVDLAVACKFNFRDMLTEIEKGVMCRDSVEGEGAGANDDAGGCVAVPASVAMDWASMMDEMLVVK
jgi:DNA polymerase III gamma/tau subunit